ncbi:PREDICTED: DNA repair protein XRCC3 [Myotis davidii]|uniref:DNA repair protein XRCC3 n=1 Tax=Myotis davidii TaxID=225400 RepID=UPI0003EC28A4|nr:PREDICTED: DNA repair protein XRCC3 [Myotis davidii]
MDLDQLDLNPRIIAAAKKAKLKSMQEVLHFSGPDLQRLTGLSGPDVQHLLRTVCSHLRGGSLCTVALQLCLAVQLPRRLGGLEAGAVYVCTEDAFPDRRLQQLIAQQRRLRTDAPGDVVEKINFGDHIFIEHVADVDALLECVRRKVPLLLSRGMVRLVRVVFAPHLPPSSCSYTVSAEGVRGTLGPSPADQESRCLGLPGAPAPGQPS